MTLKDTVKYYLIKIFFMKSILFSFSEDRKWNIKKRIVKYIPFFYDFNQGIVDKFNIIVPLSLHSQQYINAHPDMFITKTYLCPPDTCIALCDDKEKFHNYLSENGFKQVTPRINENFSYPYVIKKKTMPVPHIQ